MPELHKDKPIVVNPTRVDPYKNFKFHVTFGGKIVAAAKTVSGIPRKITGMNKSTDITLKRGVIGDSGFSDWIKQVSAGTARLKRKNLILELHDEIGNKTSSWTLGNCRVSSFKPLPSLDKKAGTIAIETLVIQSESLKLNP